MKCMETSKENLNDDASALRVNASTPSLQTLLWPKEKALGVVILWKVMYEMNRKYELREKEYTLENI